MSGSTGAPKLIAWDTCVFSSLFKREENKPLDEIRSIIESFESGKINLLCSIITYSELMVSFKGTPYESDFIKLSKRSNFLLVNVDARIAEKAAEIREKSIQYNKSHKGLNSSKIKLPDALIIATSLLYRADEFNTHDSNILRYNQHDVVDGLLIREPYFADGQPRLKLNPPD